MLNNYLHPVKGQFFTIIMSNDAHYNNAQIIEVLFDWIVIETSDRREIYLNSSLIVTMTRLKK